MASAGKPDCPLPANRAVEKVTTGQFTQKSTQEHAGALPHVNLPTDVQAMIAARLVQLSTRAREVIGVAAVIGRIFTFEILKRASKLDEDALIVGLDELWPRRVIREQGSEGYDFSHEKLREPVYVSLSAARRRILHARVADALVSRYAADEESLNTFSRHIAFHYEQAGALQQAIVYSNRAAECMLRIYANIETLAICQQVLQLLEGMPDVASTREWRLGMRVCSNEWRGDVLLLTGESEAARAAFEQAHLSVDEQDSIRKSHLYRKIAKTWELQQRYDDSLQAYHAAEEAFSVE